MVIISPDGALLSHQCCESTQLCPCIFEYIYLARYAPAPSESAAIGYAPSPCLREAVAP